MGRCIQVFTQCSHFQNVKLPCHQSLALCLYHLDLVDKLKSKMVIFLALQRILGRCAALNVHHVCIQLLHLADRPS
jgi:hypothetical protein